MSIVSLSSNFGTCLPLSPKLDLHSFVLYNFVFSHQRPSKRENLAAHNIFSDVYLFVSSFYTIPRIPHLRLFFMTHTLHDRTLIRGEIVT